VKPKKCKKCAGIFTPKIQAQPKCPDCAFWHHKQKLCDYQNKTLINRTKKPQKPLKAKIDVEQARINKIVRERDAGKPCVSCGKINYEIQAGHFHSRNQCPKLRYDLSNIHGQCGKCNSMMTQNPEIPRNYRIEIEKRIGSEELARIDKIKSEAGTIQIGKFD
jgi:5-methylcytosine-specific restriction endonuclease McrA